ncbi:MAG: AAA family ATPase [Proteobacteria bacterium]|nr:AAA family ATPase [Pseudomonadota bacterium]
MNLAEFLSLIEFKTGYKPKASGKGFSAKCPCHDDKRPSLSIAEGNEGKLLIYCHAGCSFGAICEELGVVPTQLFNQHLVNGKSNDIEHYYYHDENGNVLYRKSRTPSKEFYFERMENGRWIKGIGKLRRVLYNLPEVITAIKEDRFVHIVEGERDVETLRRYGYTATTNDSGGGKSKWNIHHTEFLEGARINLFYDYDKAGVEHRENIIGQLNGHVKSLKVIDLPGFEIVPKNGKDITDWMKKGKTAADLKALIEEASSHSQANNIHTNKFSKPIINAVSIETLLTMNIEPPEIFLDPFITKSSLGMIYAPRGLGKTFFALGIAMAIASGGNFLKFHAKKPRRVVYLDGEMSIYTMKDRIEKIYSSHEVKPPLNYFKLVNSFLQEHPLPDLCSLDGQRLLEPIISEAEIIIVDNLSCWMTSGIENEGESWLPVLEWALRLRRQGKAVIFIHHANKRNEQRGTSRREDALDHVIKLSKPKKYKPEEGASFIMSFEKNRSWYGEDVEDLEVKLLDLADGKRRWEWSKSNVNVADITDLQGEGKSFREIADELGTSASTVCRRLKKV